MILGDIIKQPSETFPVEVDFTNELATGETVASGTVTSRETATGADSTGTVLSGAATLTGAKLGRVVASGGTHGDRHMLAFTATTSAGNIYQHEVELTIREI